MRQFVRTASIASIIVGLAAVAGAQAPTPGQAGKAAAKPSAPARPANLGQVLATVNGETITREDLYRMLNANQVPPPTNAEDEQSVYQIGIEGLVNSKLIKQYLEKQAEKQDVLKVTEKDIDAEFADFEKKLKQDGQDVHVALASHGVTVAQVRDDMRSALRWRKYLEAVATKDNLKKFVAENKDVFNRTQVRASHIGIQVDRNASADAKAKAKEKLAGIKREIDSKQITFADAANKYSDDTANKSSPNGGDLGYFVRKNQINEQFAAAAFAMKPGVVSDPVETPYGYHLILVTDRKEGTPIDFDQNELLIRTEYAADVHERIVASERKTAKIKIEPIPADLFPKAPTPTPGAAPAQPAGKAATPPGSATPK
jgi:peptidyl-prolyl cis-trans isomerase C